MKIKTMRVLILVLLGLLIFTFVIPMLRLADYERKELVTYANLYCVTEVCVVDPTVGSQCSVLPVYESNVTIIKTGENNLSAKILIEPTGIKCKK